MRFSSITSIGLASTSLDLEIVGRGTEEFASMLSCLTGKLTLLAGGSIVSSNFGFTGFVGDGIGTSD